MQKLLLFVLRIRRAGHGPAASSCRSACGDRYCVGLPLEIPICDPDGDCIIWDHAPCCCDLWFWDAPCSHPSVGVYMRAPPAVAHYPPALIESGLGVFLRGGCSRHLGLFPGAAFIWPVLVPARR